MATSSSPGRMPCPTVNTTTAHTMAAREVRRVELAVAVTWETLRDLASFRSEGGCALSLYLGLDPSESPTPQSIDTRLNSLLSEVEKEHLGETSDGTRTR